ncbi:DNA translocase FtsK [Lentilactobacillus senioris]|uniref:DNA translocase FtsK n=1 Tax=Lentilactobacillus senioris TaxID=931534 RepID=UPI002281E372|nr:DNA translocase FtsK [Lentilactobacillus senioris]MCY9806967.1 DNA translocase FtsK [Lentilactobacillus senioris]
MNNYDGPAYYRWRKDLKAVQRTIQQNKQPQQEAKKKSASRGSQSLADTVAPIKHRTNNQPSQVSESKFSKQIRKFEPKKRTSIEEPNAQMVHFFDRQSNQRARFYERLIANLKIKPDDLILFGDPNEPETITEVEQKPADAIVTVDELTENKPALLEPDEEEVVDSVENVTKPADDEVSDLANEDIKANKTGLTASDVTDENVEITDLGTQPITEESEEESVPGGLGKTFSSIMGEEATETKLPFFDDQSEKAQTDREVAALPESKIEIEQPETIDEVQEKQINQRFQNPVRSLMTNPTETNTDEEQLTQSTVEQPKLEDTPNELTDSDEEINLAEYQFPSMELLTPPVDTDDDQILDWIENQIDVLDKTLAAFGVDAKVVDWTNGPTVTQFQIKLALGVKVQRIVNLRDDLKLALAAKDVRIEAPIPGKSTVGIEIPNKNPRPVMLSEIIDTPKFAEKKSPLTTAVGVDISGRPQVTDIRKMPHGLIAGATGSGKSVFINSLLVSILYKANPAEVKLLLIDPKAVELAPYDEIPHLLSPVISDPQEAAAALKWVTKEMDERYEKLSAAGVRNIEQFNDKAEEREEYGLKMPYILVIIDELADLMMVASSEIQDYIVRITQKARAAGIHLIVATQRPSVDIVTGTIKNNIPTRIAFMVSSQVDSRTIIDTGGAESLLGKGDMLYLGNGAPQPIRLQGAYVTNEELENVVDFVKQQGKPKYLFTPDSLKQVVESHNEDELMPEVLQYISNEDTISTSKLQRLFSIGYNRAANIIDALERHHYISEQHGSKPREVYYHEEKN